MRTENGRLHAWDWEYLWDDLAAPDAAKAFRAVPRDGRRAGPGGVLHRGTPAAAAEGRPETREWIEDLDHDDAAQRENATSRIRALGSAAESGLRDALAKGGRLERKQRLEELLADAAGPRVRAPEELGSCGPSRCWSGPRRTLAGAAPVARGRARRSAGAGGPRRAGRMTSSRR
jgi:hypothetical protein